MAVELASSTKNWDDPILGFEEYPLRRSERESAEELFRVAELQQVSLLPSKPAPPVVQNSLSTIMPRQVTRFANIADGENP